LETTHFRLHYPREFEQWTHAVAVRLEGVDSAVSALVGFTPAERVDVVVDDPYNEPNGSALPFLNSPVLNFWPVPPSPREDIGSWRTWGEMLSVHEFAHLAHLTRPSRNPLEALVGRLAPVDVGPLTLKTPRWAIEGYATYVEGRITGSGRPNGAWRAAVLRRWALEGNLPTYDQMSAWSAFDGGDFAYLAGSAFLEWLTRRDGDSSLVHVWRRASARVDRSFDDAFSGVFGDSPRVLYGRFTAELTAQATDAAHVLRARQLVEGTLVQHLDWQTGDPALSRDGSRVALVLRSASAPSRVVVWRTTEPPSDTAAQRRVREMLARDPEDVAAHSVYPAPRTPIATLDAVAGRGFYLPRFLPGGERILVSRATRQRDGTFRPDLYLWTPETGAVRRLTVDGAADDADPSPTGRDALATRCAGGACGVVRVGLDDGAVTVLLAGNPTRSYYHPRFSPDGRRFVVSVSDGGRWRLAIAGADGTGLRFVGPSDGASRYDAVFRPSGDTLVYASDLGGVINLAELNLATGRERELTRVTGAAVAPAVDRGDGSIWFLSLHARGYDLRRLAAGVAADSVANLVAAFGTATPPAPVARDTMPVNPVRGPLPFGLGPRQTRYLPGETYGADGFAASLFLTNSDVIGRLSAVAGASYGARPQWNGGTMALAWRGTRVQLDLGAHWARQRPSLGSAGGAGAAALDASRQGGVAAAAFELSGDQWRWRARAGVGVERLSLTEAAWPLDRTLGFAEWAGAVQQSNGKRAVAEHLALHVDAGRTGVDDVVRTVARGSVGATGFGRVPAIATFTWGRMSGSTLSFERFAAGGLASPLVDSSLTAARLAVPGLPNGAVLPPVAGSTSSLFDYRIAVPMGLLAPYYEAVSVGAGAAPGGWHRLAGVEAQLASGAIPQAYLPGFDIRLGAARSFDAPFAARTTVYCAVRLIP
jgi:Tol biopolymer transport system component